ncbi:MAG TPA: four helix bundle protein [Polyangiaceae bacterium]
MIAFESVWRAATTRQVSPGRGRSGDKELARFRSIAAGSTSELDYQLVLARDLGHLPSDAHAHLAEEVSEVRRMLYRFIQSLNAESG